jgi:hypothetical protein
MSKKLVTLFIILTIGLLIGIVILDGTKTKTNQVSANEVLTSSNPVLFYETTCPNCLIVEDFITQNKIEEKMTIQKIEVSSSTNAQILVAVAQRCNIPTTSLGVPLLWAQGKCYQGRIEVIDYLKAKAGISETTVSQSSPTANQ